MTAGKQKLRHPKKQKSRLVVWCDKIMAFNVEQLFSKSRVPGPPRTVFVNGSLPEDYYGNKGKVKKEHVYKTNQVVTSKYTIVTFLPRNLLEQFRRIANIFFAAIAILQFFHEFSTISPGLVILPLLIVLGLAAAKDGYEDVKRHQSDRRVNLSTVRVLNGGNWVNPNVMAGKGRSWTRELMPFLPKGRTGGRKAGKQGASPDTEMGQRTGPPEIHSATMNEDPELRDIEFDHDHEHSHNHETRRASQDQHGVSALLHHKRDPSLPHWRRTAWEDVRVGDIVKIFAEESFPADILICATSEEENVCFVETKNLDGETNLKSRNAVQGLTHMRTAEACADPEQTRFRIELDKPDVNMYKLDGAVILDNEKHPIDLQTVLLRGTVLKNTKWIVGVVMFTGEDTKIVLNAGGTPSKRSRVERQMNPQVFINLILLAVMAVVLGIADSILEKRDYPEGAPWLVGDNQSDDNPNINGLITWAFAYITFQNIVPISLYISIEVVRTCQAAFIYFDKDIWYSKTDQPTMARSWNLSDDLGQIEYIFSDKTGTLTQNSMVFRHCSIGGKVYRGEDVLDQEEKDIKPPEQVDVRLSASASDSSAPGSSAIAVGEKPDIRVKKEEKTPIDPVEAEGVQLSGGVLTHFHNVELAEDIADAVQTEAGSDNSGRARTLNGFFSVLALCHTVLAVINPDTQKIEYRAQSPDEAALVQAAADAGFVFRGRDRELLRLQTPFSDEIEVYELLNVLDFTSARKRMSVIIRKLNEDDGRIFLLSKGADNVIFERLKPGINDELKEMTGRHLDEFASEGLRTLTLAYKAVPAEYYEEWSERYADATVALEDREEKIAQACEEIEQDLRLLGATAIEDRLQDGVPETIADLKLAGIKVWVATGDKLETAIAIGYSTNLIAHESNLIVIRAGDRDSLDVFDQMYNAIEEFFPESNILEEERLDINEKHARSMSSGHGDLPLRRVNTGVSSIVGRDNGSRPGGFVLVIEGTGLTHAFADEESKRLLLRLAMQCEAVICCRVSPLQKALIVKLVKEGIGAMTLAIGDGANDVSMIQAADVGIGISGEEGLQAVNSSDYAIAQFRFLKRLLLVHGHYSYARNGNMIVNFFYKNILGIGVLWWFQIYCGWSSQYVFEYTYLLFWNVFWTLCPVIAIGLFDRIVDDDILMALPELYSYGREGYWFTNKILSIYLLDAVYQSAIIFFILNYAYFMPSSRPDGYDVAQYEFSTTMAITAVMAANLFNGLNTAAWTGWVFFAVNIGIILIWAYTAIYSIISPGWFYVPVYGNDHYLFHSAIFWLSIPICLFLCLVPRYIAKAYRFNFAPTEIDKMRMLRTMNPNLRGREQLLGEPMRRKSGLGAYAGSRPSLVNMRGSRTDMATGIRGVHRGFDFSQEEGGVAIQRIQTNLSERRRHVLDERADQSDDKGRRKRSGSKRFFSLRRKNRQTSDSVSHSL